MSSYLSVPAASPQSEDDTQICEKLHKQLMETLPRGDGWRDQHVYYYNGFWLDSIALKNNLLLHTYFKPRPTDIFLAAFMKSGTTWLKALMFSILNRDRYAFSDHPLLNRSPQSTFPLVDLVSHPADVTNFPRPRLFNTHYARTLLPDTWLSSCRFVYVWRDPKDVLISKWIFMAKLRSKDLPPLSLHKAYELFCQGVSECGPFWEHVLSYWQASLESSDKILFLKYEELNKQPEVAVRKLALFMGKPVTAEEEKKGVVGDIVKLCSFEHLSNLEANKKGFENAGNIPVERSSFFQKGEIENWKNYLSEEMKDRIDKITDEKFRGSGLNLTTSV